MQRDRIFPQVCESGGDSARTLFRTRLDNRNLCSVTTIIRCAQLWMSRLLGFCCHSSRTQWYINVAGGNELDYVGKDKWSTTGPSNGKSWQRFLNGTTARYRTQRSNTVAGAISFVEEKKCRGTEMPGRGQANDVREMSKYPEFPFSELRIGQGRNVQRGNPSEADSKAASDNEQ